MNVIIFTDTYPPQINGVGTSSKTLHDALVAHGDKCMVVTTNPYNYEIMEEGDVVRIPGMTLKFIYDYKMAGIYNKKVFNIVKDFKPDVIHIQTEYGIGQFGFISASKLNVPAVSTYHTMMEDYAYYVTKGFFDAAARGWMRFFARATVLRSREFVTPSDKIREYMRSIGVDGYINVIPTGIDFDKFSKSNFSNNEILALRAKYGIAPDEKVVLSLGRVAKEKSIDICIKGFARYLRQSGDKKTKMVIVGGGPAVPELKELCEKEGIASKTVFVGPVPQDEVPRYYQLGDVFVSASITETQGLTFMEAMASDLVLFARYDDTLISTIHDGENGYFFFDEEDFANKLPGILSIDGAKKKDIIEKAHIGLAPYSLELFYQKMHEVYKNAIRKNW